jgi:hypothetical protein
MQSSNDAKHPAPIFLICSERSGSNLISTIVGEHPAVYAHPPYHMGRDLIFKLHEVSRYGAAPDALHVLVKHAQKRISKYRGDEEAARLAQWIEEQDAVSPPALARFVFQEMPLEAQGKHAFVKENNVHELLFFLVDCFPDAKLIFQVRDPRDFLLSAKLRKKRWLGNKFGSLRNALNVWREDQVGGLNALGLLGPERVFLLRYEDLVAKSDDALRDLCAFLGLEFDERMHDFHQGDSARRIAGKRGPRENVAKPLMTSNFRKYLKGLSKREVRIVEAYVGDLMDRFGYPREYSGSPSIYTIMRPQLTEPLERFMNRELRPQYRAGNRRLNADLAGSEVPLCSPLWKDERKGGFL